MPVARFPVPDAFFVLHKQGKPFPEIASACGVCERTVVRWIRRLALPNNGGRRVAGLGCSYAEGIALNDGLKLSTQQSKHHRFQQHRKGARKRGIGWEITFAEWVGIWVGSGKWDQRGVRSGEYVMGRKGDVGPYRADNVDIILSTQNTSDGNLRTWARRRAAKQHDSSSPTDASGAKAGSPATQDTFAGNFF